MAVLQGSRGGASRHHIPLFDIGFFSELLDIERNPAPGVAPLVPETDEERGAWLQALTPSAHCTFVGWSGDMTGARRSTYESVCTHVHMQLGMGCASPIVVMNGIGHWRRGIRMG